MAKQGGLGDVLFLDGFDLSGDTNDVAIGSPTGTLDFTDITMRGNARGGGLRDGLMQWTSFFDPGPEADAAHDVLSLLPTADAGIMYGRGTGIAVPAACMVGKQIDYPGTRDTGGSLLFKMEAQANGFGLEWCKQLTPGKRVDAAATQGDAWDRGAGVSTAFGAQAYLQVFGFTGTDATVTVQHSADGVTYTDLIVFNGVTTGRQTQRAVVANTTTVNRFLRVITTTSGGFTSMAFAVAININPIAAVVF